MFCNYVPAMCGLSFATPNPGCQTLFPRALPHVQTHVVTPMARHLVASMFARELFVQSRLQNYRGSTNIVWHHCTSKNMTKMEKLNKRALQIIFNDYTSSYEELLVNAKRPYLYLSRIHALVIFKSIHSINPAFLHDVFIPRTSVYEMRNQLQLVQPSVHTEKYGIQSFRYQGSKIWNSLPDDIKYVESFDDFKRRIKTWDFELCICNYCAICKLQYL